MFFTILLIIIILFFLVRPFMPRIIMWLIQRRLRKQMDQVFGQQQAKSNARQQSRQQRRNAYGPYARRRRKIIDKNVGEYVEFEEIRVYQNPASPDTETTTVETSYESEQQVTDAVWEDIK